MRVSALPSPRSSLSRAVRMVERGGDWGVWSMARAVSPIVGRQVRNAAITEAQKRIGSLSRASSESQAKADLTPCTVPSRACGFEDAATHADSSVVLPLPAEAETSVKG